MPVDDEAHTLPRPEPAEATTNEDVRSARADPSVAASSSHVQVVPTISTQQAEEDDIVLVTGPGNHL